MDPDRRHKTPRSELKRLAAHSNSSCQSICIFLCQFLEPISKGQCKQSRGAPAHTVGCCRNPGFFKDSTHADPLFQKETRSVFPKAVCYTNIIEKIAQNKVTQSLCSQNRQKCKRHTGRTVCQQTVYFSARLSQEVYLVYNSSITAS